MPASYDALIANYLALVYRRMRVTAFTQSFGQISPIIPYIFTAPFYFARKIELGVMTQTAGAFGHVPLPSHPEQSEALTHQRAIAELSVLRRIG